MERIKELRERHELSQREFAKKLHVSQTAVSQWETRRTSPDYKTLIAMADFFEVSTDFILGRTPNKQFLPDLKERVELNGEEKKVLQGYRAADNGTRRNVRLLLNAQTPAELAKQAKQA